MKNIIETTISHLSHKGLGVVKHPDGRVFFARGAWTGDKVLVEVDDKQKNYDIIKIHQRISSEIQREENICPHRGAEPSQCGGCPWMEIPYSEQLKAKEKKISFLIDKNSLSVKNILPIIPSPDIYGYRNRAQFKTDGQVLGYVTEGTNIIAPISECRILNPSMQALLKSALDSLPRSDWKPGEGFSWNYLDLDDQSSLENFILNKRRPFRQGNEKQNQAMKAWIETKLSSVPKHYPVIELFAGSGNFTESLSRMGFSNILATEVRGTAIEELENKNLDGVRALALDMNSKGVWSQIAQRQPHGKILLVDPPREGIDKKRGLFKYFDSLETVLYISCEPHTWARDMKEFLDQGWEIEEVTPLDLFPHTPHVEVLSLLRIKTRKTDKVKT